jgi:hypothetical protein
MIFQIGFNKCGTTSIHELFIQSGLKSVHWAGGNISKKIQYNIDNNIMPLTGVEQYDCYTDIEDVTTNSFPFINHYKLLNEKYPDSLFILNTRPVDKWITSRFKHAGGYYVKQYKSVLNITSDEELISQWTSIWNKHHKEVLEYFENNNRFIMFDIESEGDKLVEFLKSWSIPAKSFLHLHKSN